MATIDEDKPLVALCEAVIYQQRGQYETEPAKRGDHKAALHGIRAQIKEEFRKCPSYKQVRYEQ